jgi:hypothetical protein
MFLFLDDIYVYKQLEQQLLTGQKEETTKSDLCKKQE